MEAIGEGTDPNGVISRLEELQDYIAKLFNGSGISIGSLIELPGLVMGETDAISALIDKIKDTIIEKTGFDVSAKKEGAWYKKELSCENGSLGVSIGAYDAYAEAKGGIFTKDDDGNIMFNPNVDAKMGASFTAFEAAGAYAIGNEMFGGSANGHITAGKVSGEAQIQGSLRGSDGSFDPHIKASASAEVVLIDAEAQAGVTVLGTKAEVKGSVNIGVGAHADFEFGDGKIECDIGASLGIGASISFTIDYGGTVDAVKSAAKSAVKDIGSKLFKWMS